MGVNVVLRQDLHWPSWMEVNVAMVRVGVTQVTVEEEEEEAVVEDDANTMIVVLASHHCPRWSVVHPSWANEWGIIHRPTARRSPSQDSFRQRHQSNNTPPKRSPSQDSYRSGSPSIKKGQLDRKLNRRMSDETASLTGSSGSSNPGIDTSERTGTSGTTQGTLASTSSASKHVIQLSPVRRSSYGSSQQEKIESIMNSSPSSPRESSSSKSSSSSSREKKRSKSVCNTTCCLELRTFEYRIVFWIQR